MWFLLSCNPFRSRLWSYNIWFGIIDKSMYCLYFHLLCSNWKWPCHYSPKQVVILVNIRALYFKDSLSKANTAYQSIRCFTNIWSSDIYKNQALVSRSLYATCSIPWVQYVCVISMTFMFMPPPILTCSSTIKLLKFNLLTWLRLLWICVLQDNRDTQSDSAKMCMDLSMEAALKLDAVICLAVCINHDLLLDCPLVAFSKFWACSYVTCILNIN